MVVALANILKISASRVVCPATPPAHFLLAVAMLLHGQCMHIRTAAFVELWRRTGSACPRAMRPPGAKYIRGGPKSGGAAQIVKYRWSRVADPSATIGPAVIRSSTVLAAIKSISMISS